MVPFVSFPPNSELQDIGAVTGAQFNSRAGIGPGMALSGEKVVGFFVLFLFLSLIEAV